MLIDSEELKAWSNDEIDMLRPNDMSEIIANASKLLLDCHKEFLSKIAELEQKQIAKKPLNVELSRCIRDGHLINDSGNKKKCVRCGTKT